MGKKLFKSELTKDIAILASSSFIAQGVNFAFSVILARLYLPEYFGTLSIFLTIVGFITIVSAGKFDIALVATIDKNDTRKLFTLSFIVLAITTLLLFIAICIVYAFGIDIYKGQPVYSLYFYLLPALVFLTGTQIIWMLNVRDKNFRKISFVRIVETLANGLASLAFFGMAAKGLLFGALAGQFITFLILLIIFFKNHSISTFIFSWRELKDTFNRYRRFPKINIPQGFLDMFQMSALVLFLSKYYGAEVTGYYALCWRVLQLPMRLIVQPVANVFFAEASELNRNGNSIYPLVKKTLNKSLIVLSAIPVVLIALGPMIFTLVYSEKWVEAGVYAQILAVWIFFDLIRSPISQVASILGKQKQLLIIGLFNLILFSGIIVFGAELKFSVHSTLLMVSITQTLMCLVVIFYIIRISKRSGSIGHF